jgi:formyltetrahydrofolate deformylase
MNESYILTFTCPDQVGIVHAVTGLLAQHGANVTEAAQYTDTSSLRFFMRVRFDLPASEAQSEAASIQMDFAPLAKRLNLNWRIWPASQKMRTVLMVSKLGHCLNDLLYRYRSGLIPLDVCAVVSNHRDYYQLAAQCNIPFYHIPVTADTKPQAEAQLLELVNNEKAELVVLARYMQVLSDDLCRQLDGKAINIHHSFLPSFKGARPYYQAHDRGVKIIGATAHYVTADLDEGPIIEQDVARVDHAQDPEQFTAIGRDVESVVLSRAVTWHAQHRVLRNGNKTVVFR